MKPDLDGGSVQPEVGESSLRLVGNFRRKIPYQSLLRVKPDLVNCTISPILGSMLNNPKPFLMSDR